MPNKEVPQVWLEKSLVAKGWRWSLVFPVTPSGEWMAATMLTTAPISEGEDAPSFMTLPDETMQRLMNQMWNAGFRPSVEGSEGELQATKKHLEDMRKIVFDMIGLQK